MRLLSQQQHQQCGNSNIEPGCRVFKLHFEVRTSGLSHQNLVNLLFSQQQLQTSKNVAAMWRVGVTLRGGSSI